MATRASLILKELLCATAAVLIASLVRAICQLLGETIPYTPFYPAIVVGTIYGRLRGGLITLGLAAFAASFWLIPFGRLAITETSDLLGLGMFLVVGIAVVVLCERLRRAQSRAEIAAAERHEALNRERAARARAEEASRLKDDFIASVSHELRTPLQAMLGWSELLAAGLADKAATQEGLNAIKENAQIQAHLIDDLLDMGRLMSGKMRLNLSLMNPRTAVEAAIRTVAPAANGRDIRITKEFGEETSTLTADADRFQQIVWNLLSNAIKFSPPDTTIRVSLSHQSDGIALVVTDQGCGLDPEFAPLIFDRFSQADPSRSRRHSGLGLGLSIVKNLVEMHGGTVTACSQGLGQGTTMTVVLPRRAAAMSPRHQGANPGRGRLSGIRVLVVDDDQETCELVRRILEQEDAAVTAFTEAEGAISAVEQAAPDLIISDIGMPGQDGCEMLRKIHAHSGPRRIPAMALTGYDTERDRSRSFEAGFAVHLAKPVQPRRLAEAVEDLVRTSG